MVLCAPNRRLRSLLSLLLVLGGVAVLGTACNDDDDGEVVDIVPPPPPARRVEFMLTKKPKPRYWLEEKLSPTANFTPVAPTYVDDGVEIFAVNAAAIQFRIVNDTNGNEMPDTTGPNLDHMRVVAPTKPLFQCLIFLKDHGSPVGLKWHEYYMERAQGQDPWGAFTYAEWWD